MAKVALLDHEKFDHAIKELNLKQEQIAERLNISDRHVRNLKSRNIPISASLLYQISTEFEKPMEYFLTFQEKDESTG